MSNPMQRTACTARSRDASQSTGWQRTLASMAASAAIATIAPGQTVAQGHHRQAPEVRISPNAIQDIKVPMTIDLVGTPGEIVYLFVLRNCDRNRATPELRDTPACKARLWTKQITLDIRGHGRDSLDLSRLAGLQPTERLWLRASSNPRGVRDYQDAVFGVVAKPCSLLATFGSLVFADSRCPSGLQSAIGPQRGVEELPDVPLEARRLAIATPGDEAGPKPEPITLPGTHNATGVAWQGTDKLLVTIRRRESEAYLLEPKRPGALAPGIYRFDLKTNKSQLLMPSPDGYTFIAPIALQDDCIAFMSQRVIVEKDGSVGHLIIWRRGKVLHRFPMYRTIHQILAFDPKTMTLIAYSRWKRTPTLLHIDLRKRAQLTDLGFHPATYYAAMHSPRDPVAIFSLEDNGNDDGWELVLVDHNGQLANELAVGPGHDLLPTWHPNGTELAYIGQSGKRR